jgi:hypothetical protein
MNLYLACTTGGGGITEETEDGVGNPIRVVELQAGADSCQDWLMGVFFGG